MRQQPDIPEDLFVSHGKEVEAIFERAVRETLLRHKKLGNSVVSWQNGEVIILLPEEIEVGSEDTTVNGKHS
jgi:hypothetical protein